MPCEIRREGDVLVVSCGPTRGRARCEVAACTRPAEALCDFALRGTAEGRTCDRRLCAAHRHRQGAGRDYCPAHASIASRTSRPPMPVPPNRRR